MPSLVTSPYSTAEYVTDLIRSEANDATQSLIGNLLADTQPYLVPMLNSGYRHLQIKLIIRGFKRLKKRAILYSVGAIPTPPDPGLQVAVSYTGYFNGQTNFNTPTLPADLLMPMVLKERQSGTLLAYNPMYIANDGLPSRPQGIWLRDWIWRDDEIQMCGATQQNDIELQYAKALPNLVLLPTPSLVLISFSENTLAYYTIAKFAESRGSPLAGTFFARGDESLKDVMAMQGLNDQRKNTRRRGYTGQAHNGWGFF
jgi:hypothetical protein